MLAWLERNQFLALGAAGFLLLAGLLANEVLGESPSAQLIVREGAAPAGGQVRVQVTGAVAAPGVYALSSDARVEEAIAYAGGVTAGARPGELNLARRVRDGERIDVPGPAGAMSSEVTDGPIDLNRATQAQLMTIEGIGDAYSRRIIDSRSVDGAFRSVDELRTRNVLPLTTFEKVRDYLTVAP